MVIQVNFDIFIRRIANKITPAKSYSIGFVRTEEVRIIYLKEIFKNIEIKTAIRSICK